MWLQTKTHPHLVNILLDPTCAPQHLWELQSTRLLHVWTLYKETTKDDRNSELLSLFIDPRSPIPDPRLSTQYAAMSSESLFSPDLISSDVAAALPDGYTIRPLQKSDYRAGFLDVLAVLTTVGDVSEDEFIQRFEDMRGSSAVGRGAGGYHILVILNGDGKIVGTGALIVEKKL